MAQITDTLLTVFQVSGISALLSAMTRVAAATNQITAAQSSLITSNLTLANTSFAAFQQLARGVDAAIQKYVEFGNEVMNIRDLSGSSAQEAAKAVATFRIAGVSDLQQIREVLHLSQAVFSQQGRSALSMIGVAANPNVSGLELFNQIADALERYPDGIMKAQIATEIFGARSVQALLPLLRLTHEQRERAEELGNAFDTTVLPAIQAWQFATANLGETIEVKLIFPIVEKMMPALLKLVDIITYLVDSFANLDKAMHGALSTAIAFFTIGSGIALIVRGVVALVAAYKALLPILRANAVIQAFMTALSGPGGVAKVIAAGAVAGVAVYGLSKLFDQMGDKKDDTQADKFGKAVDKFDTAINTMTDWRKWNKGGIPGSLDDVGMQAIARQMALGAIG